jgi:hypothetical protein
MLGEIFFQKNNYSLSRLNPGATLCLSGTEYPGILLSENDGSLDAQIEQAVLSRWQKKS